MSGRGGMQGALILLLAPVFGAASCVSAPDDGVRADLSTETGGTGAGGTGVGGTGVGGNDGEWTPTTGGAPTIGTGGVPAAGGAAAGGSANCYGTFYSATDVCGQCVLSLDQLCAEGGCGMPDDMSCNPSGLPVVTINRGCGYVERAGYGDVGDSWSYMWIEATGELVYFYSTPGSSSGVCYPSTTAGEWPVCNDWQESCDQGLGGQGGAP